MKDVGREPLRRVPNFLWPEGARSEARGCASRHCSLYWQGLMQIAIQAVLGESPGDVLGNLHFRDLRSA
jgi:hypothetical protein